MQRLSKRLQAVAELAAHSVGAAEGGCAADIGTDHGYIPIWLVEQKLVGHAIAMDIGKGPLQRAREHIEEHQLGAYIETRLSDGLAALKKGEAQVIIIAGMGGATMSGILEAGKAVIASDTVLVLQPQSELLEFRQYLFTHGYKLLAEDMVEEDGKYYPMMKVCRSGKEKDTELNRPEDMALGQAAYTEAELRWGPMLLAQRHPVLREFLVRQSEQKEKLLAQLGGSTAVSREAACREKPAAGRQADIKEQGADRRSRRKSQIEAELSLIRQVLLLYEEE